MTQRPALARALDLEPHPEGGWYRETYRSAVDMTHPVSGGKRASATLIHFLLEPGEESRWHAVASDEIWLWQGGGPLLLQTTPPGAAPGDRTDHLLGPDLAQGQTLQLLVPAGHWQRAEPAGGQGGLVGCLVTPGFDFADFTMLDPS